jgi:endoglucanase
MPQGNFIERHGNCCKLKIVIGGIQMKRLCLVLLLCLIVGTVLFTDSSVFAAYNYGEALQKSIYFYECQQSGTLPSWNRAKQWRGDSCTSDYITGGWYDAGDHVKFGLPMAYSAAMLGWSMYEYGTAISGAGQSTILQNNLKFVLDYLVKCDQGTSLVYQIGDGGTDHAWWGPVEVIEKKMTRPYYTCTASCVCAETAAALAIGAKLFDDSNYLAHAKSLFALADSTQSDSSYTAASGYYTSYSGFWDELIWAATWLYIATGDTSYLTKAESYVSNLSKESQTSNIAYKWAISWDDVHLAALFLLDRITGSSTYDQVVRNNLNWMTVGDDNGAKVTYTSGGLAYVDTWGSLRYASNEAFLAFVYSDFTTNATLKARYKNFAVSQIDYILGSNPRNSSYIVGFGNNSPAHPHHRTSQGSYCDDKTIPSTPRHIFYGALVGGPNSSDSFSDAVGQYQYTEPACDYNALLVGNLAKMYSLYGGTPLTSFPEAETVGDEFFVEASINSSGSNYTEIRALCNNRSGWPARLVKNLSFKYYMDLSEVLAAGYKVSDLTVSSNYVEFPVTFSAITQYSGNIYYIKVSFTDGTNIYPGGQSQYAGEVQFRIAAPSGTTFWNPANDYSYTGLTSSSTTQTKYIPVYNGTTLLYGVEPGSTVTSTPTPTPTSVVTPTPTPIPTPTSVVTPTPTPTPSTGYTVAYAIQNDWGSGASVNVTITNNSSSAISSWTLAWIFSGNQTISNLWNASYTQSGTSVSVTNLSYNGTIAAGGSASFGFNLTYSGTNAKPTSFTLNGTSCQVQ